MRKALIALALALALFGANATTAEAAFSVGDGSSAAMCFPEDPWPGLC